MPPYGFHRRDPRHHPADSSPTRPSTRKRTAAQRVKPTLFDTVDSLDKPDKSLDENRRFLAARDDDEDKNNTTASRIDENDDDDESSLSEAGSDDFEDVPPAKRHKPSTPDDQDPASPLPHHHRNHRHDDADEDDEMAWEDALRPSPAPAEIADVSISLQDHDGGPNGNSLSYVEPLVSAATNKKGPSKRERQIRLQSHRLHVQALMWHNAVRNHWLNDLELRKILLEALPQGVMREVERWKEAMGMCATKEEDSSEEFKRRRRRSTGGSGREAKGKTRSQRKSGGTGRDWYHTAERAERGAVDLSRGDPLLRLLKILAAYWRKRFTVTAPGIRKQGYKSLRRLGEEIKGWEGNRRDFHEYGERIENLCEFRQAARKCEGSRDVGAQLFVALLRSLGLETRMVANLQPVGFGWSKAEEADEKKVKKSAEDKETSEIAHDGEDVVDMSISSKKKRIPAEQKKRPSEAPKRKSLRGEKTEPIDLDESDSPLSSPPTECEDTFKQDNEDDDDLSVVDLTPISAKKRPGRKYDRDLAFPNYWTEVCSPVSHKFYPVDPIVLSTIASTPELLQSFEPRGRRADLSKQVVCYTMAFSADGSAKDVTVRYLKKHQLPGKTKGMRSPIEKESFESSSSKAGGSMRYDWFQTLMSLYTRPDDKRTPADDVEEQTDLKPFKPVQEKKSPAQQSLQWYKQSPDYVLEQHLRREEALLPGAKPVNTFVAGKGDKVKTHPVYRRSDVAVCKTVESWHKEGRAVLEREQPIKYVPMRAVTLSRKREIEDAQRETGEKLKQGLYARSQTDWIIPPPIENGVIPRNAFGNIDVYVPSMVPEGAVHLPLRGAAKVCKRLGIDFAEACTGFEFGKQRAVPVLTGVVVAEENQGAVRDAWRVERAEQARKQDEKRRAAALQVWRKMVLGLRVLERMRVEYADEGGGERDEVNPFVAKAKREGRVGDEASRVGVGDQSGGFLSAEVDEDGDQNRSNDHGISNGGFLAEDTDAAADDSGIGGGFLLEEDLHDDIGTQPQGNTGVPITPVSLQSLHKTVPAQKMAATASADTGISKRKRSASRESRHTDVGTMRNRKSALSSSSDEKYDNDEEADTSLAPWSHKEDGPQSSSCEGAEHQGRQPTRRKTNKASSPSVVRPRRKNSEPAKGRRTTPAKSQYFRSSRGVEDTDSEDAKTKTALDDEESEDEVVQPRRTTARTKRTV